MRRRLLLFLLAAVATAPLPAQSITRGIQRFDAHDRAGARAEFSAALERNDRDAAAHYYLGRLALLENDRDAAAEHLARAVQLDDTVSDYHLWYGNAISERAIHASKLKLPFLARRAKTEYERAVALDERNLGARDKLVDFYSMAPGVMGGNTDRAREQAQAIARIDAMRGHLALGRLAMRAKDTATVEREMNAAIAASPDTLRGYWSLAYWYGSEKRWPQAFATLDRYIQRRPDDPYGPYNIGRIAAISGQQIARGEQGIRALLAKPPKDAAPPLLSRAYLLLGQLLEQQGKDAEARGAIEQAVRLDPRNEEAREALK